MSEAFAGLPISPPISRREAEEMGKLTGWEAGEEGVVEEGAEGEAGKFRWYIFSSV